MVEKIYFLEKGSGTPLVFLHGIGSQAETWRYQLEEFSKAYHVYALDLPGYGRSAPLRETTFPNLAVWLQNFLLEKELIEPILVGNSFGGMIVQEYLARFPGKTRAIVLTGTSPAFGRQDGEWQQKFIQARLQPLAEGKTMAQLAPTIARGLIGSGAQAKSLQLATQGVAAVQEETFKKVVHCLVTFDQRKNLERIDIPSLLLVGEEDRNAPPSMMKKMASKILNAQFICLPELGHLVHLEDPAKFNAILNNFLENLA